jgi:outer membrane lipoprotein-sorting protein
MTLRRKLGLLFATLLFPGLLTAQSDDLLTRIWQGMQQSHAKITTICGTMTETRTSKLLVKPMVLHGRFCAAGADRFMLEYAKPDSMIIRFNNDYLNITADGKTEAMDVSGDVRHAQSDYANESSPENLEKKFTVTAQEDSRDFELRLVPRSQMMRHRLNYLDVRLNKQSFLPRSVEVDGKSGVNSVFVFEITSENARLPENTFEVVKPQ